MKAQRTIESLQAGRGIAALGVVTYHSAIAARDFSGSFAGYITEAERSDKLLKAIVNYRRMLRSSPELSAAAPDWRAPQAVAQT